MKTETNYFSKKQSQKATVLFFYFLLFTFYFGNAQQTEIKYLSGRGNSDMVKWGFLLHRRHEQWQVDTDWCT